MDAAEVRVWIVLTLYGGVALAIFTVGLFALNDQHYVFGAVFTVAGLGLVTDAARRALGHGFTVPNSVLAVLLILTWIFFGYDIYDRRQTISQVAETRALQPSRIEAFKNFLAGFPNPGSNLRLFAVGKSACQLADEYKDTLASAGWIITVERCLAVPTGLEIRTQSVDHSPASASTLRRALENAGLKVGWNYDPSLASDQFILIIGNDHE
jgi:hypothetical protein